jgi:AcrR family transcriptional regulator
MNDGPGLRARKKQRTRQQIELTARRLFIERGFEQVSVAEIAKAAEVSEATVYNHFPTKEDLVYGRMQVFEDELLQAIRERPTGEPVLAAFGRLVLQPRGILAAADPAAAEDLAGISRVIAGSPALLAREAQILARYTDALADLIAGETGAGHDDPRPWTMANALIGVHRAVLAHLRQRIVAGHDDLRDLAREVRTHGETALALFTHGLGDYAPKPPARTSPSSGGGDSPGP